MAEGKMGETLIAFRSGHYKKVTGYWKGDSVWCHFNKPDGGMVHINKTEVEYMETFGGGNIEMPPTTNKEYLEEEMMKARIDQIKVETERLKKNR